MWFLWLTIGIAGGILGGMGMGGGTLTIPLLTGLAGLEQRTAQAINLIAFLPMSVCALLIHAKNGLVRFSPAVLLPMLAATAAGVLGGLVAQVVSAHLLRRAFGIFLAVLGAAALTKEIVALVRAHRAQVIDAAPARERRRRGRARRTQ